MLRCSGPGRFLLGLVLGSIVDSALIIVGLVIGIVG
jgi:hypothetical protein